MTEKGKMLSGKWYFPGDDELVAHQVRARKLLRKFNHAEISDEKRKAILTRLLGSIGKGSNVESLFSCDYGFNVHLGKMVGLNFGCVLLDCGRIEIGDYTLLGPGVHVYAVTHPLEPVKRRGGPLSENCKGVPVKIGRDCWIGGGSRILPGVTIGDGCIVGAGSIVTHDVPSGSKVAGNPARLMRES
jgi:maltose O-acetyltransferase